MEPRNQSNINDLHTRIKWGVTTKSAQCCVAVWAVENLTALKGIVWSVFYGV